MFQTPEILFSLAEVSIALVGFTGIVVALQQRSDWSTSTAVRFSALVWPSVTALGACYIPELVSYFQSDADTIWRLSNGLLGVFHLANISAFALAIARSGTGVATRFQLILAVIGIATILAHFAAALGLTQMGQAIFIIGVLQQLGVGLYNFVLSLLADAIDVAGN